MTAIRFSLACLLAIAIYLCFSFGILAYLKALWFFGIAPLIVLSVLIKSGDRRVYISTTLFGIMFVILHAGLLFADELNWKGAIDRSNWGPYVCLSWLFGCLIGGGLVLLWKGRDAGWIPIGVVIIEFLWLMYVTRVQ